MPANNIHDFHPGRINLCGMESYQKMKFELNLVATRRGMFKINFQIVNTRTQARFKIYVCFPQMTQSQAYMWLLTTLEM